MESNTYMVAGQTFELQHYGVKGMKWGRRRAIRQAQKTRAKFAAKAQTARESAHEWDEMARYAEQKGKTKRAAKYRANAAKDRADAADYERQSGPKKKVSTGKKSVSKSLKKVGTSTVRGAAKTASIGSQMVLRMMQNQVTYTTAGRVFDDIYNR